MQTAGFWSAMDRFLSFGPGPAEQRLKDAAGGALTWIKLIIIKHMDTVKSHPHTPTSAPRPPPLASPSRPLTASTSSSSTVPSKWASWYWFYCSAADCTVLLFLLFLCFNYVQCPWVSKKALSIKNYYYYYNTFMRCDVEHREQPIFD